MKNEEMEELFGIIRAELKSIVREVLDEYFEENEVKEPAGAEEYMKAKDVAKYTSLSPSYIYQKAALPLDEGGIPSVKIGSSRIFVKSEIDEWMKADDHREEDYEGFYDGE